MGRGGAFNKKAQIFKSQMRTDRTQIQDPGSGDLAPPPEPLWYAGGLSPIVFFARATFAADED